MDLFCSVLETDSNDSLSKDEDSFSLTVPTLISDQMQKHLLSSTMLGNSRSGQQARPGGSGSPTDICTTPSLSFVPTPSPSPFTDLGFSLASDHKQLDVNMVSSKPPPPVVPRTNYVEYEAAQPARQQQQSVSNLQQIFSSAPAPPPPGQTDVKLVLMESSPSSIPNSLALLTPEPISIIQPSSGPRYSVTASSNSSISQVDYPARSNTINTNLIHPNKKKRLLTFLTEQENSLCSVTDNNQIILAPSKPEQILFNSG